MSGQEREPVARITIEDLASGTSETQELRAGGYLLLVTAPCHLVGMTSYRDGRTVMLRLEGREPTEAAEPTREPD